jgi:hypothetical protein
MMAAGNDVVKYLTQKIIKYLDEPKDVRSERRRTKQNEKEPMLTFLFGMVPMGLRLALKKIKKK